MKLKKKTKLYYKDSYDTFGSNSDDKGYSLKKETKDIKRNCLRCHQEFLTENKFIRTCDKCKKDMEGMY